MRTLIKMNFDPDIAKHVGVNAAIIFENVCYWVEKNRLNEKHFYDNDWWTYNSKTAFEALFPWLTYNQIRSALDKLREEGYLKVGKYNKHSYDQTMWYALGNNEACEKTQMHWGKNPNGLGLKPQPIPNDKPNDKRGGTHRLLKEYVWKQLPLKEQILLLRSIMTITGYSDVQASAMVDRLKKIHGDKLETAYRWLYADVLDGKLSANYFDFTSSGGGVVNNMPESFERAKTLMEKRIQEIEAEKPGFIASRIKEVPQYDI